MTTEIITKPYLDACIKLAKSVVFKMDGIAKAINSGLVTQHGLSAVDETDPASWKYYKNIAGIPHITDPTITIKSLDIETDVTFDKSLFSEASTHPLTKQAYGFDSEYFNALCLAHPDQIELIRGIVMPCDISVAIASEDMTILAYDASLVESSEPGLMVELQSRLFANYERWAMPSFAISNDLYITVQVARIYSWIVKQILAIRQDLAATAQVHSFHIQQRLASNRGIDEFITDLTRQQQLYLYSCLPQIAANIGKNKTFNEVVEALVSGSDFDVYGLTARHYTGNQLATTQISDLHPTPTYTKQAIVGSTPTGTLFTQDYVFSLIANSAQSTAEFQSTNAQAIRDVIVRSPSSVIKTKIVTIEPKRINDDASYPLESILLAHWLQWAQSGKYTATLSFTLPNRSRKFATTIKNAAALFLYCSAKMQGITLVNRPATTINNIFSGTPLSLAGIEDKVCLRRLPRSQINAMRNNYPFLEAVYTDVEGFKQACAAIHFGQVKTERLINSQVEYDVRMYMETVAMSIFSSRYLAIDTSIVYASLLSTLGIDDSAWGLTEYYLFANELFLTCTNFRTETGGVTIQDKASRMMRLLSKLCSYSVLITTDIALSSARKVSSVYAQAAPPQLMSLTHSKSLPMRWSGRLTGSTLITVVGGFVNGHVWIDLNDNQTEDPGEQGAQEINILFLTADNTHTATTDINGNFSIFLPPNIYTISVTPGHGQQVFYQSINSVEIIDGQTTTFSACVASSTVVVMNMVPNGPNGITDTSGSNAIFSSQGGFYWNGETYAGAPVMSAGGGFVFLSSPQLFDFSTGQHTVSTDWNPVYRQGSTVFFDSRSDTGRQEGFMVQYIWQTGKMEIRSRTGLIAEATINPLSIISWCKLEVNVNVVVGAQTATIRLYLNGALIIETSASITSVSASDRTTLFTNLDWTWGNTTQDKFANFQIVATNVPPPSNGRVDGKVWQDLNDNQIQDVLEVGAENIQVIFTSAEHSIAATTSAIGEFSIVIPVGTYTVEVTSVAGYHVSYQSDTSITVAAQSVTSFTAGVTRTLATVFALAQGSSTTSFVDSSGGTTTFGAHGGIVWNGETYNGHPVIEGLDGWLTVLPQTVFDFSTGQHTITMDWKATNAHYGASIYFDSRTVTGSGSGVICWYDWGSGNFCLYVRETYVGQYYVNPQDLLDHWTNISVEIDATGNLGVSLKLFVNHQVVISGHCSQYQASATDRALLFTNVDSPNLPSPDKFANVRVLAYLLHA